MANIKLDFSKMKHVRSDKDTTTLQHPSGHQITLVHKALAPDNQKALSALSAIAKDAQTPREADQMKHKTPMMAEGGDVEGYLNELGKPYNAEAQGPKQVHVSSGMPTPAAPEQKYAHTRALSAGDAMQAKAAADKSATNRYTGDTTPSPAANEPAAPLPPPGLAEGGKAKPENAMLNYKDWDKKHQDKQKRMPQSPQTLDYGKLKEEYKRKNPLAEGGQVCHVCGGAMMAEGGNPPANLDPNTANAAPDIAASATPDYKDQKNIPSEEAIRQARIKGEYDRAMEAQASVGTAGLIPVDMLKPREFSGTPEGQEPQNLDPDALIRARKMVEQQDNENIAAKQDQENQLMKKSQALQSVGINTPNPMNMSMPTGDLSSMESTRMPAGDVEQVTPATSTAASPMQTASNDINDLTQNSFTNREKALQKQASALGEQGKEEALQLKRGMDAQTTAQARFQTHYNELEAERQAHMQDIQNGYIDPDKYWKGDENGNGSHSKIAAGIGMILAGFNPTNKPNAAIDFLKYQMDQNLTAQAKNLDAKNNLLAANLRQFGNLHDAAMMTRVMQNDVVENGLKKAAATSRGPLAQAALQQAVGQLQAEKAQMLPQLAMRKAMMSFAGGNSGNGNPQDTAAYEHMLNMMKLTDPKQAEAMSQYLVPGVGISSKPVPNDVITQIQSHKTVNDFMNQALDMANLPVSEKLKPTTMAQAATLQGQLIGAIKNAQKDGVYKESEANYLLSQVGGSPASLLSSFSSEPKVKELQKLKQTEYSGLLKSWGLPSSHLPQNQPQQKPVTGKDGRQYIRQGNYMVPVR